jgi:transcription elongation factor Elf1
MFKYECPHCHEKTISPIQKMLTGGMGSKGTKCKKCGRRIVNGKITTAIKSVVYLVAFLYTALILITEMNQGVEHQNYGFIFTMWAIALVGTKIIDGFIPDVERCIRNDTGGK